MTDLQSRDDAASSAPSPVQRCHYCGAPLNAFYYFCVGCGTPYKDVRAVITPAMPRKLTEGELVARKAPMVAPLIWTYVGTLLAAAVLAELFFTEDRPDLKLLLGDTILLIVTCVIAAIYRTSLAAQFKVFGFNRWQALAAIAVLVPLLGLNWVYHGFLVELAEVEDSMPLNDLREAGLSEVAMILLFCAVPAVTEEIAFRGLIQHWLAAAIAPGRALLIASALFAGIHFSVISFPYLMLAGLVMGWAKWKTGSLYPSMVIHFVHNLVVIEFF